MHPPMSPQPIQCKASAQTAYFPPRRQSYTRTKRGISINMRYKAQIPHLPTLTAVSKGATVLGQTDPLHRGRRPDGVPGHRLNDSSVGEFAVGKLMHPAGVVGTPRHA